MRTINRLVAGAKWLRARLSEGSTWAGIGAATAAAAAVPAPYNLGVFVCSIAALICKDAGHA